MENTLDYIYKEEKNMQDCELARIGRRIMEWRYEEDDDDGDKETD